MTNEPFYTEAPLSDGTRARLWVGQQDGRSWAVIEAHGFVTCAPAIPSAVVAALGKALSRRPIR